MKREITLDLIKGVCIILVVLIHAVSFSEFPAYINNLFSSIFLQGFFFVSGYLLYEKICNCDCKSLIRRRFFQLLIPYCSFSFLSIICHIVLIGLGLDFFVSSQYSGFNLFFRDIVMFFSGIGIGTLWFLPILFFSILFFIVLYSFLKRFNTLTQNICYISLFIILSYSSNLLQSFSFPETSAFYSLADKYLYNLNRLCFGLAYIILGFLFKEYLSYRRTFFFTFIIFVHIISFVFINSTFMFNIIFSLSSCILLYYILYIFNFSQKPYLFCNFISFLGKNSLLIMFVHYNLLYPIEKAIFSACNISNNYFFFMFNFLTTILLVYLIYKKPVINTFLGKNLKY